jgi:hypothetical protein
MKKVGFQTKQISSSSYNPNDIIPINPSDPRITKEFYQKAQEALLELQKFVIHCKVKKFDVKTKARIETVTWTPVYAKFLNIGDRILSDRIIFTVTYRVVQNNAIFFEMHSERRSITVEYNPNHIVNKAKSNG